jgi:hypothetical protein
MASATAVRATILVLIDIFNLHPILSAGRCGPHTWLYGGF